jgi:serine/threonine-protein kinase RIM15
MHPPWLPQVRVSSVGRQLFPGIRHQLFRPPLLTLRPGLCKQKGLPVHVNRALLQILSSSGIASRRLSRSIHIPIRPTRSGYSSRSTPRSRSPLPPNNHSSFSESRSSPASLSNRRASCILIDNPVDPIMNNLYKLISLVTDVIDMTVACLTSQPKNVEAIVQRVQTIGKVWNDHPDPVGMATIGTCGCSLRSPASAVLSSGGKPADDHIPPPAPTPRLAPEEGPRLRLSRPASQGKRP